jgi:putative hydroxymethylpyrimidine transporter CytX
MNIRPVPAAERNLGGSDFFLLWAGVAISLAEIWAGGLLAPMGLWQGIWAIALGHLIGNSLMAMGGLIGSEQGITSMVSVRPSFGILGSNLAAALNVVQLVCWASIMLIIGGRAGAMLGASAGGIAASEHFWIVVIGGGTLLWAFLTGRKTWKLLQVTSVVGLILVLLYMSFQAHRQFVSGIETVPTSPAIPFMTGLDLVIAMPISWMPLVADYSRFARSSSGSFWSTWWGYFLVSSWMYVLGLSAALATGNAEPHLQLLGLLGGAGLLTSALLLVVFSTITSDFPDIYSATCSILNVTPKVDPRMAMALTGILSILIALVFPMERYQGFLFFIGAMFVPLFGVVLTDYFLIRGRRLDLDALYQEGGAYWYRRGYHLAGIVAWVSGFATYESLQLSGSSLGGSLPSMVVAGALYFGLARRQRQSPQRSGGRAPEGGSEERARIVERSQSRSEERCRRRQRACRVEDSRSSGALSPKWRGWGPSALMRALRATARIL